MADFDWVRARSECSLPKAFERIFAGVKSDVDARNAVSKEDPEGLVFESSREGNRILVIRGGNQQAVRTVTFALTPADITVERDGGENLIRATPGLSNPGDCTLTVESQELELWQFRRMALENLFFGNLPRAVTVTARRK
jgi:hypothetical protein